MAGLPLSKASEYEQTFRTRHRGPGRPSESADGEVLFPSEVAEHPLLADVAMRRAYALVHHNHRDELGEHYQRELKVLKRRGVEVVAADTGRDLNAKRWGGKGTPAELHKERLEIEAAIADLPEGAAA